MREFPPTARSRRSLHWARRRRGRDRPRGRDPPRLRAWFGSGTGVRRATWPQRRKGGIGRFRYRA